MCTVSGNPEGREPSWTSNCPRCFFVCFCMVVCNTEHVMKKFLINLVCCFVPSRKMRHRIRGFAKRVKIQNNTIEIMNVKLPNSKTAFKP